LTSLMGPMSEGPDWPAGAAWLAARHNNHACIISDGLSDPWVERERGDIGLGLEVYVESPDAGTGSSAPLTALADTWLFPMLAEISHILANSVRLCERLTLGEVVSLEFNIDHFKDGRGRTGALLNMTVQPEAKIALPGGDIRLVAATLLTAKELSYLPGKGEVGRRELVERLNNAGYGHLSLLHRPSLI
jgi:hypothetical protein